MRQLTSLAVLLGTTAIAAAKPTPLTFRRLYSSIENPSHGALTTYTLTREGDAVTLDVRFEVPDGAGWKLDRTESLTGTSHTTKHTTVLALVASNDDHLSYECTTSRVRVAAATAKRELVSIGEMAAIGRWSPKSTSPSQALVCTRTDVGSNHYLDSQLVFAARAIEHVEADNDCCHHAGDSLRWLPADRSVVPARRVAVRL